jgi:hypothetical protein
MSRNLSYTGKSILRVLVDHIAIHEVIPERPETFISYKEIHDILGLSLRGDTYGDSLKIQGLSELANWTYYQKLPAVTGLIIDRSTFMPGQGFFQLFGRREFDFEWWQEEIRKSIKFDWSPFL